jgi:hypothetical protein
MPPTKAVEEARQRGQGQHDDGEAACPEEASEGPSRQWRRRLPTYHRRRPWR